jgi:hypothetical protein
MTFPIVCLVFALAAFLGAHVAGLVSVAGIWRRCRGRDLPPADLLLLRLAPSAAGLIVACGIVLPAFLLYEPRHAGEAVRGWLLAAAAIGLLILAGGAIRVGAVLRVTGRVARDWRRDAVSLDLEGSPVPAFSVDAPFPIVSVVGVLRPRLFVARSVVDACTPAELRAVVAHEAGHVRAGDNLKRLLMAAAPDLLPRSAFMREIEAAWQEATEEAADAGAVGRFGRPGTDLAAAMLVVARLASARPAPALPLSMLFRGGSIERRVRRLLDPEPARASRAPAIAVATLLVVLGATLTPGALRFLHGCLESLL